MKTTFPTATPVLTLLCLVPFFAACSTQEVVKPQPVLHEVEIVKYAPLPSVLTDCIPVSLTSPSSTWHCTGEEIATPPADGTNEP